MNLELLRESGERSELERVDGARHNHREAATHRNYPDRMIGIRN